MAWGGPPRGAEVVYSEDPTMRIATLNIYWFGLQKAVAEAHGLTVEFFHAPNDDLRVAHLVEAIGADVVALQEIVDVERLERALGDSWLVRDTAGHAVASRAPGPVPDWTQRVVFAWRRDALELVRWSLPIDVGPRRPVVGRFRDHSGHEFTLVAVHPKSGNPASWDLDAEARRRLFDAVAAWLVAQPAGYEGPYSALLGDFNSVVFSHETEALRTGALSAWSWSPLEFSPSNVERRTTRTDSAIIDHILLSPALAACRQGPAVALAFDADPTFAPTGPEVAVWKSTTDHRPVWVDVLL